MNNINTDEATIVGTLESLQGVREVKKTGPMRWGFAHHNGTVIRCEARRDGPWLVLGAALPRLARGLGLDARHAWRLLVREGALPGGCRYALTAGDPPAARLRAEVLLAEDVDLGGRLQDALASFEAAFDLARKKPAPERLRGNDESGPNAECRMPNVESMPNAECAMPDKEASRQNPGCDASSHSSLRDSVPRCDLRALCQETGWPLHEGDGQAVRVDLELPREDGFYQAEIREEERGFVASAQIAAHDAPPPEVSDALGVMLLTANGTTRMARATATEGERIRLGFEVVLPTPPGVGELADVLACLSVACRHCGREADAMDAEIAKEYLLIRGWSS